MRTSLIFAFVLSTSLAHSACAYRFGLSARALPGGYTQVAIPVFKNATQDVGIEMYFTDALILRFARSQVARVTDKELSPVVLEGVISKLEVKPGPARTSTKEQATTLPENAVQTISYRIVINVDMSLRRKSDEKVVWQGSFQNETEYFAPQVGTPIVNSVNAAYNLSARQQKIATLADEMMAEAHERMTENF